MTGGSEDPNQIRVRELERRVQALEARVNSLSRAFSVARHSVRRVWLRPPIWTFEQHQPRAIAINHAYRQVQAPPDTPSFLIVTPSFNQGHYLRATVESVLGQNYPNLHYHVQDGASNDGTRDMLQSFGSLLSWQSDPDEGQAQAINRGFAAARLSDVMAYLNSDDVYLPGTLAYVARIFQSRPDVDLVYGHRVFIDRDGLEIGRAVLPAHNAKALIWADYLPQETLFWRRRVWDKIGPLDESFDYALDWDFVLRAQTAGFRFLRVPRFLACFRVHDEQKTAAMYEVGREEMQRLRHRYLGYMPTQAQIERAMIPYLGRQLAFHWAHRLGVLRY
jgi:hypothetical protein